MNWPLAAASIMAVFAVAGVAWWLGLGGADLADERAAMDEAEAQVGGFEAASARLTEFGAEVTGVDGRIVQIRRLGARWTAA